ncbi:hypothetical protein [Sphingopyxis macrogoltabida]|uniref:Uncharacterized protein n=1 Tax=Sphingopyxis macrogoltabida TaxID=33050 RepID=A0AAC8YXI7_SPHMC|nr:hypothetical protein [Sphingopyxis macrogoltabida]ALJ11864.1 hypothetical protein LH19_03185 [Sphingopyxis macrogoltabida]AMU88049.1 hypothetical protein ATM17_03155 [Sphingopyxis macrogoltabida]
MTPLRIWAACAGLTLALPASGQEHGTPTQTAPAVSAARLLVPAGSVIDLVTTNSISSQKSVKGDLLYLKVAAPVVVDGVTVIPIDTVVVAQLQRAEKRGAFGRSGKLDVQLLYAELPGGTLRVSGMLEARGKHGADDAAATAVAFLAFPFIATGRSAEIPAGSEVSGRLDRDLWLDGR